MISVVMATFNGEKFLHKQLDSICNQTLKPDEIVISDDNSSDTTKIIIQSYMKKTRIPIRFFCNIERLGYASNFRRALQYAQGDIIFLSDQDDIWDEKKIEICKKFFDEHEKALALSTAYQIIDGNDRIIKSGIIYKNFSVAKVKKIKWKLFLRHPKYPGMAMTIRRKLLNEVDLSTKCEELPHDWQLNQNASYQNEMYFLNVILVQYRQHQDNTAGTLANNSRRKAKQIRGKLLNDLNHALETITGISKKDEKYLKKVIEYQRKRKELYDKNKNIQLLFYNLLNIRYVSLRSMVGDLYAGMQG